MTRITAFAFSDPETGRTLVTILPVEKGTILDPITRWFPDAASANVGMLEFIDRAHNGLKPQAEWSQGVHR